MGTTIEVGTGRPTVGTGADRLFTDISRTVSHVPTTIRLLTIITTSAIVAIILASFACSEPPPVFVEQTVEVIKEVQVTVPVEIEREVEVTREVPVTLEVEVIKEVQVTVPVEIERESK